MGMEKPCCELVFGVQISVFGQDELSENQTPKTKFN